MNRCWGMLLAFLYLVPAFGFHPPAGEQKRPPTKAKAALAESRQWMDAAKRKLAAEGKYNCCIKPQGTSRVAGCDLCARTRGTCTCGADIVAGKGVCGQCLAVWKVGQGTIKGVDARTVTLAPAFKTGTPSATTDMPELRKAREALDRAKRILVAEGRFACCIGEGGCDECAFEESCPCGVALNEGKEGSGVCGSCYDGWRAGKGVFEGLDVASVNLAPMEGDAMQHGGMGHGMAGMSGMHGDWTMNREGSGTSWLPDSSPMYARMGEWHGFHTMLSGMAFGSWTHQSQGTGKRGDSEFYVSSQLMGMAWKPTGPGIWGGRVMLSADPSTMGAKGYPLLFQTGETAYGKPLVDRQHPHDGIMELAGTYSYRITPKGGYVNAYLAPVGEPAIGPTAYPHRPSAMENPEAPITHHWFDSTHITYGVATVGIANHAAKLETSLFTGREPDEKRYTFDRFRWDSRSVRLSVNPTPNLSAQVSAAYLRSPEALEPDTDVERKTVSVTHNLPKGSSDLQSSLMLAQNRKKEPGQPGHNSDALLLESAFLAQRGTIYGRWELVQKDELFPDSPQHTSFTVGKWTLGGIRNISLFSGSQIGVGGSLSLYSVPSALRSDYGSSPISFNLFIRIRTAPMAK